MWFPRPMNELEFQNEWDIILFTLSLLLDRFEKEHQLFAAQCIWWLASVIQFTEIWIYYQHYKIFPSDYFKNPGITLLDQPGEGTDTVPDSDIPELNLDSDQGQCLNSVVWEVASGSTGSGKPTSGPGSIPELSNNPTCCVLAGQTWTHTHQPAGFAWFG